MRINDFDFHTQKKPCCRYDAFFFAEAFLIVHGDEQLNEFALLRFIHGVAGEWIAKLPKHECYKIHGGCVGVGQFVVERNVSPEFSRHLTQEIFPEIENAISIILMINFRRQIFFIF